MIEGIDRTVDLIGVRSSGLTGGTEPEVVAAIRRCDTSALAETDGHFAAIARDGRTVRLGRTIGIPLGTSWRRCITGRSSWCRTASIGCSTGASHNGLAGNSIPHTRGWCLRTTLLTSIRSAARSSPRYQRFFDPRIAQGSPDVEEAGVAYIRAVYAVVRQWLSRVPVGAPVGVGFSGGIDSTATLLLARHACLELGRHPDSVRAFTLYLGGGADASQAESAVHALGIADAWERIEMAPSRCDLEEAIRVIEDYHPLDVECAAAGLCLLRGIRERYPSLTFVLDGDGGDENLKSYPLEDLD